MTTIATPFYAEQDTRLVSQLISEPLSPTADRVELANACAAYVCALVETEDAGLVAALCGRLQQGLTQLSARCDTHLSPQVITRLIEGEKSDSCVPACWQDPLTMVNYALGLTQAIQGNTCPAEVTKTLTGLLHDMVWLLADFMKEPAVAAH